MSAGTILNITYTSEKMIFAYLCAMLVIPSFAAFMVYKFRAKYYNFK